jgi:Mn-containing catalase
MRQRTGEESYRSSGKLAGKKAVITGANLNGADESAPMIHAESSDPEEAKSLKALLVDQLRDILHAEKQLVKALPKMAKAARSTQLQSLLQTHLEETETQVERVNQSMKLLGAPARAKPCKGMAGLIEEGEEVMDEGKDKEDAPADLALISAAQRVEHYEIAAYTTARNLALQLRQPAAVHFKPCP